MEKMILGKYSLNEAVGLVVDGYRGVSTNDKYSAQERKDGARSLLGELAKDYRENKNKIFAIIEETLTEILPERLADTVGRFAEIKNFNEGDTPKFSVKNGKIKAYSVASGGNSIQ